MTTTFPSIANYTTTITTSNTLGRSVPKRPSLKRPGVLQRSFRLVLRLVSSSPSSPSQQALESIGQIRSADPRT